MLSSGRVRAFTSVALRGPSSSYRQSSPMLNQPQLHFAFQFIHWCTSTFSCQIHQKYLLKSAVTQLRMLPTQNHDTKRRLTSGEYFLCLSSTFMPQNHPVFNTFSCFLFLAFPPFPHSLHSTQNEKVLSSCGEEAAINTPAFYENYSLLLVVLCLSCCLLCFRCLLEAVCGGIY